MDRGQGGGVVRFVSLWTGGIEWNTVGYIYLPASDLHQGFKGPLCFGPSGCFIKCRLDRMGYNRYTIPRGRLGTNRLAKRIGRIGEGCLELPLSRAAKRNRLCDSSPSLSITVGFARMLCSMPRINHHIK